MTIADAFETCQLGHRTDAATNQGVEAAAGSLDLLEQHRIGIGRPRVGCIDGEPHLHPAALDPQRKLSGEDATLRSAWGRCGRRERATGSSADHSDGARPVDYPLEQIPLCSASASRLCRKRSASAMMREYRPMTAPFVERGLADRVSRSDGGPRSFQGVSWSSGRNRSWRRSTKCSTRARSRSSARHRGCSMAAGFWAAASQGQKTGCGFMP